MPDIIFLIVSLLFFVVAEAMLLGQLFGWWARRRGAAFVINHLKIKKP